MKFLTLALLALTASSVFAQTKESVDIAGKVFLPVTVTMEKNSLRGVTLDDLKVSIVSYLGGQKYSGGFSYAIGTDLGSYQMRQFLTEAGAFNSQSIQVAMARVVTKQEIGSKIVIGLELYWGFGQTLKTVNHATDFDITNWDNFVNANCIDCSETEWNGIFNSDSGIKFTAEYERLKLTLFTNRYSHNMRGETNSAALGESNYYNWSFDGHNQMVQKSRGIEISYTAVKNANFSLTPFVKNEWTSTNQQIYLHDHRQVGAVENQHYSSNTGTRSMFTVGVKMDVNFNKKPKKK